LISHKSFIIVSLDGGMNFGGGYGISFGAFGSGLTSTRGDDQEQEQQQQQQQFGGANFNYSNQSQGNAFAQGHFGDSPGGPTMKKHRRYHRQHQHRSGVAVGATSAIDQVQGIPE
jgi:hypothetical protein